MSFKYTNLMLCCYLLVYMRNKETNRSDRSTFSVIQELMLVLEFDIFNHSLSLYTDQNYKRNTFDFAPIFHELNSKI